jgi:hypothetical protein
MPVLLATLNMDTNKPTRNSDRYKTKICPTCGKEHKKRGPYCSRSCGNHRTFTDAQKAVLAVKLKEKVETDYDFREKAMAAIKPDIPIPPLSEPILGTNQFVQDGDLWTMDD